MREIIATTRLPIPLGKQGENEAVVVKFPVTGWREFYGEGSFSLLCEREGDTSAYPCVITVEDDFVLWVVKAADVYNAGEGKAQLLYIVGEKVAKSVIYSTIVFPSLDAGDVPEPTPEWIVNVLHYGEEMESSQHDAEAWAVGKRGGVDVPSDDEAYHNNSKYFAELAASAEGRNKIYWATSSDNYNTISTALSRNLLPVYKYNFTQDGVKYEGVATYGRRYGQTASSGSTYSIFLFGFYYGWDVTNPGTAVPAIIIVEYRYYTTGSSHYYHAATAFPFDTTPTNNSKKPVTSGGIYTAINKVGTLLINKGLITQEEWNAR